MTEWYKNRLQQQIRWKKQKQTPNEKNVVFRSFNERNKKNTRITNILFSAYVCIINTINPTF